MPKYQQLLVEKFRSKLTQKGNRGLLGIQRSFRLMDTSQSGKLDQYEFTQAINSHTLDISPQDIAGLFKSFDINGDGEISFEEFLSVIKGPVNPFRQQIIIRIFKMLDLNQSGVIPVGQIKAKFNSQMHPDVKSGKRSANEISTEFNETFD
jgi:Ca2+-binding EF-hand superfamily protein